ncbi:hypothetical protein D5086_012642 [Populus alba]|uniref:Uncharacterized protein n=1 Tax=Populus alba TaxID=43335 RepID=A0ACC4C2R2_POPAL
MGNCCRSPAAVAREDVKSSFSGHDHGKKDNTAKKTPQPITVLTGFPKENIEERYLVDRELVLPSGNTVSLFFWVGGCGSMGLQIPSDFDVIMHHSLKNYYNMQDITGNATVIADFLSIEEVEDIKEMFKKMDTDNDGIVSIEELKTGLQSFGSQLGESEVQMLIEAVDANGKGKLDYGEFVAVSLPLQRMDNDEHLRKAFSYFDKDGNGYIEPDELRDALMEDGADDCTDVANDIFQEVDTDKVNWQC